ncbi:hypothetical protein [Roseomonas xinghualingensis]|uniref:hypothetical protein n=1 Tax=Roseomonas xinghualingensis TaxID=2986475 RepID=UPI0021F2245B|nr:hypothetical protein [Roseomonas sp. SXEYE001]MCV4209613.1 hypothetical protein [Roseomonas sp. SXEYE001]
MPYLAYTLSDGDRARILEFFQPAVGMEVVCHHVTRGFPAGMEPGAPVGLAGCTTASA